MIKDYNTIKTYVLTKCNRKRAGMKNLCNSNENFQLKIS